MDKIWEELNILRHQVINSKTVLAGYSSSIRKEREKIAKCGRKINVLVERVELIEQGGKI